MTFKPHLLAVAAMTAALAAPLSSALANGWYESRPWQFDTTADKANRAAILDMIERKKGGYYDGFSTNIYNYANTNIGTQINCSNVADATGNQAGNSQVANSPQVDNAGSIDSSASGNQADNQTGGGKQAGSGQIGNDQSNSGNVSSGVIGSSNASSVGPINAGSSQQGLNNTQDNSGNQYASIADSTACDMAGSEIGGHVKSNITGPLN